MVVNLNYIGRWAHINVKLHFLTMSRTLGRDLPKRNTQKPQFIKRKRSKTPEPKQTRQKVQNTVYCPVITACHTATCGSPLYMYTHDLDHEFKAGIVDPASPNNDNEDCIH